MKKLFLGLTALLVLSGCNKTTTQDSKDKAAANEQQAQYAKSQPVPKYNWSLERHLVIELQNVRNVKAATHSVWRSNTGVIEGDCPSIGFGIPYDTSLTNPLKAVGSRAYALTSIEQAEPNGIFISKNTSATWVMCSGENGNIEPIYIESKVTAYPYPLDVDYKSNRATKAGKSTVSIK